MPRSAGRTRRPGRGARRPARWPRRTGGARLQRARAQRTSGEASAATARLPAERYGPVIETHAISRQDYDNAVAQARSAAASVDAARAEIRTAQINLGYTRVEAPIPGRSA